MGRLVKKGRLVRLDEKETSLATAPRSFGTKPIENKPDTTALERERDTLLRRLEQTGTTDNARIAELNNLLGAKSNTPTALSPAAIERADELDKMVTLSPTRADAYRKQLDDMAGERATLLRRLEQTGVSDNARIAEIDEKSAALDKLLNDPSGLERVARTIGGGAKQYGSSHLNTIGMVSDALGGTAMSSVYASNIGMLDEEIAALERQAADTTLTEAERQEARDALEIAYRQRGIYTEANRSGEATGKEVYGIADAVAQSGAEDIERAKQGLGFVGQLGVDLGAQGTQMLLDRALGGDAFSLLALGTRAFGGSAQEARLEGATREEAALYGLGNAAVEVLAERLFDGLAGLYGKGGADEIVERVIARISKNPNIQDALSIIASGGGESIEELISGVANPLLKGIYNDKSFSENFSSIEIGDVLYDMLVGGIMGGFGGTVETVANRNARKATQEAVDLLERMYEGSLSPEAQDAVETPQNANTEVSPEMEQKATQAAYDAGRANVPRDAVELMSEAQEEAYMEGRREHIKNTSDEELALENEKTAEYTDSNYKEGVNYGTEGNARYGGNERRADDLAAGIASGGMEARTGEVGAGRSRGTQAQRAAEIRAATQAAGLLSESTGAQGISSGTDRKSMTIVPSSLWDDDMRKLYREQEQKGRHVTYFVGEMELRDEIGIFTARGAISPDGKRIWVRADHPVLSVEQIAKHEEYHAAVKKDPTLNKKLKDRLAEKHGEGWVDTLSDAYAAMYFTDAEGNVTVDADYILEEVFADAYADIDVFDGTGIAIHRATEATAEVQKTVEAADNKKAATNSGEVRTSRDLEERRRALRKGEMVNKFHDKVNWHAYYDKLKSAEFNSDNYDDGDRATMRLGGQLLILEMQRNGEFSVVGVQEVKYETDADNYERDTGVHAGEEMAGERTRNDAGSNRVSTRRESSGGKSVGNSTHRADSERSGKSRTADAEVTNKRSRDLDAVDVAYDAKTESAAPTWKTSRESWSRSQYVTARDTAAKEMATALDISERKAKAYIDMVNSVAKDIADDQTRLDYEASPNRSSFVGNSEYGGSIDFSTICKKRRLFTGTFEAIQNALPNTALTADEILEIRSMMAKKGYEVSCGLCYVEGSRANMGQYTKQFLEQYAKTNPAYLPNMAEMNTASGQEKIRKTHPEVYEAYEKFMNGLAQRKPKMYQLATEYKGEVLTKFKKKGASVAEKNKNGGLRLQSFSDFEIIHLIDSMQVIMDMAQVGLAGQAYTKVPDFAWALGDTGLKINLSLIAKGVDSKGNIVLDETEGMARKDAEALRNRYSDNVGTIIVVFNDVQLSAAMRDPFIDYIIPFHRSQWNSEQYEAMGLPKNTKNFTPWQNESYIEPVYNKNGKKQRPSNYMPNEYWDFSKSGKENAETYLAMCAANNRRPKFHYLLKKNSDGSYSLQPDGSTDGYWKTLIDFKMYNNDGKGVPQMPVKPEFNMDEAKRMLNEYTGGHQKFPVAQDIVDKFVRKYKKEHEGAKFSREADQRYLAAVERGDTEAQERMVREAARAAGYDSEKLYHGTMQFGFTKLDVSNSDDGISFFATNDPNTAQTYSGVSGDRRISDVVTDEEAEEIVTAALDEVYDFANDFVAAVERVFPYTLDYDDVGGNFEDYAYRAEKGEDIYKLSDEIYDYYVDVIAERWEATDEYQEFADWQEGSDEWYKIEVALSEAIGKISDYVDAFNKAEMMGNYALYANTDGLLEVDGKGASWKKIEVDGLEDSRKVWSTRSLASYAYVKGYKGVKFKNIVDEGGKSVGTGKPADVYIFFKPQEQVKSADPVTYDGKANVIPLSERFNPANDDIRYSREVDQRYLAAINRGDMETTQKMVDNAAKAAGYTEEVFHGMGHRHNVYKSGNGQYGEGVYFTYDKDTGSTYGGVVDHLYVKVGKIADYDDAYKALGKRDDQTLDEFAQALGFPSFDDMVNDWDNDPTDVASNDELIELLMSEGFEGFVDEGNGGFVLWGFDGIAYRIKLADPVTYDDDGNIIPLSERFNEKNPDIRYSREANADVKMSEEDAARLREMQRAVREELNRMGEEYGWIKQGENPFREANVPRKTDKDKKVSQTVRTILEAKATPDAAVPNIEKLVADGAFSYDVYTDKEAIADAEATIKSDGYAQALADWTKSVTKGEVNKANTALGWALYNNAANSGDLKTAMTILNLMVGHQRNAAQAVQATRILKKLSPEAQLYGVVKSARKLEDDLNNGKQIDNGSAKRAAEAVSQAKREAAAAASSAHAGVSVKRNGNRVVIDSNQAGEPFVFEYAQKVGESLAKSLEAKRNRTTKEKTFLQQIVSELNRFASEKLPKEKKGASLTAIDLLRDYIQNQSFYAEAWQAAQLELRDKYADDPILSEFINSSIGVDANINPQNAIFMRALVKAAADSGEGKAVLRRQDALGFTGMADTIANNLISQTNATGEIADTIRDAAHSYVYDAVSEAQGDNTNLVDNAIRSAMKDIGITLADVVMAGNGESAQKAIVAKLISKYGFGASEATWTAAIVADRFSHMSRQYAEGRLKSMFKERSKSRKTIPEKIEMLARLGAFDVGSAYNQQAAERIFKEGVTLTVNEELAAKFLSADTQEERDNILADIYRDIGRQIPASFADKWNAWRYLSMLGNPRTHVRNIFGNAGFAPVVATKNMTATAIEAAVSRVSGGKIGRTKGLVGIGKADRALLQAAWSDYQNAAAEIMAGGKYSDAAIKNQHIEEGRVIFKTKAIEVARKKNSEALEREDVWFAQPHYAYALAQYCKANGVTADQLLRGKALGQARAYAIKEAQKATYRDTNAFSELISRAGRYHGNNKAAEVGSALIEGILPFRKTPANILVRGVEYSPVGLLKSLAYDLPQVAKGNKTAAEAIDNISAGLTGTGLLALGILLAAQGLVRGAGGGDDDKNKFEELQGHQTYALELPNGTSVTLDWLAPECLPFFIGVNLWEQTAAENSSLTMAEMLEATQNVTEPLLEMSCLQSLNDVLESVGNVSSDGISAVPSVIASAATSYLTQGFPTLFGQIERVTENTRNTTYTEKDAFLTSDMQYTLGNISGKLPREYNQIPYIDAWGRKESTGNVGERAFNNLLNPAYTSEITTSAMEEELLRLYEATGERSVLPSRAAKYFTVDSERVDLTGEEYVKYATRKGQTAYDLTTKLTKSSLYKAMTNEQKVRAIEEVYDYANQTAKAAVSGYKVEAWVEKVQDAKKHGISPETYICLKTKTAGIESLKDKNGETIDNSKGLQIMQMVYNTTGLTEEQRKAMFEYLGVGKAIRHYNKSLVDQKLEKMRKK